MKKTLEEINEKIREGKAVMLTAEEMTQLVKERGAEDDFRQAEIGIDQILLGVKNC